MIEKALNDVGAARSIVVDENGVVLAGNATVEAAAAAGIERVQVVDADGQTIIAVRRTGLTPEQKAHLAIYDNRSSELAAWNVEVLADIGESIDLSQFWTKDEIAELMVEESDRLLFEPVGIEEQGRLDEKAKVTCPECGHVFVPKS